MYDSVSQLFVALLVVGYVGVLAALTWWALGPRISRAVKKVVALASLTVMAAEITSPISLIVCAAVRARS
jgi:Na+/melibiose symporter-like transporter